MSDMLIIPGFGKITKEYFSAELDRVNNKITAPFFRIYFDFEVHEDEQDEFLKFISKLDNISFEDAAEALQNYKKSIFDKIYRGEQVAIEGIGTFVLVSDSVQFESKSNVNESLDAFPVSRELKSVNLSSNKKGKRSIFFIIIPICLILSLLLILAISFYPKPVKPSNSKREKNEILKTATEVQQTIKKDSLQKQIADSTPTITAEEQITTAKEYIIVVGTYNSIAGAQRIEKQLKADGFKPTNKKYNNGKIRVGVAFSGSISDLNEVLKRIRLKYDNAAFVEN
jgi:hypothetical protein